MDDELNCSATIIHTDAEVLQSVLDAGVSVVAIDAPLSLPKGRASLEQRSGIHFRACDRQLHQMKIKFFPLTLGPMRKLTERGMRLKTLIERLGLSVVETYPGAAQDLLGIPRKGRGLDVLTRGLRDAGISGLDRPMTGDELDAVTCALVGVIYLRREHLALGDPEENLMILPGFASGSRFKFDGRRILPYPLYSLTMEQQCMTLADAAAKYLAGLSPTERDVRQQEIFRFVRWFGKDRTLDQMRPPEIGRYGEQISAASSDASAALEPVRAFLTYARKTGLTQSNYSLHLRAKKAPVSRASRALKAAAKPALQVNMSAEGFAALEAELVTLEGERPKVVEEIQKAAADKDFRENAPLHAAKERQGYLEGRIREIEATLKAAKVVADQTGDRIGPGDYVVLKEVGCDDELCLTVVHAREANPQKSRISMASPIGKAVIGHKIGDTVQVSAPVGVVKYHVVIVERNRPA